MLGWSLPLGKGIAGYVAKTGELQFLDNDGVIQLWFFSGLSVNSANAYDDRSAHVQLHSSLPVICSRFDPTWDCKTNYRTTSVLCMPVKVMQCLVIRDPVWSLMLMTD